MGLIQYYQITWQPVNLAICIFITVPIVFTNWGVPGGRAWGVIRSEKNENHKNSSHTKIEFYTIYFFSMSDIKMFTYWGAGKGRVGGLRYLFRKMRKAQEQYNKIKFPVAVVEQCIVAIRCVSLGFMLRDV